MNDIPAQAGPDRCSFENLDDFNNLWRKYREALPWTCPFVLPPWVNAWWKIFGQDAQILVAVVRQGEVITGIAPLMIREGTVRFLGDPEVCDYFDFVVSRERATTFFSTLFASLSAQGLRIFDLGPMRPDAAIQTFFGQHAPTSSMECRIHQEDVFSDLDLPHTWDEFLEALGGKQRHELRRKLRRLGEAGEVRFRRVDDLASLGEAIETFLRLFSMNREDKAAFMTGTMASFFHALAVSLVEEGMLRLFFLELNDQPVASVFCFDYQGTRYLYNNSYDRGYQGLSVGLLSKVWSLKAAIDEGLCCYNFLKGGETYKRHLGGNEIPLLQCKVTLR